MQDQLKSIPKIIKLNPKYTKEIWNQPILTFWEVRGGVTKLDLCGAFFYLKENSFYCTLRYQKGSAGSGYHHLQKIKDPGFWAVQKFQNFDKIQICFLLILLFVCDQK